MKSSASSKKERHRDQEPVSEKQAPAVKASEITNFFENTGVTDALIRAFITMYEEKEEWPANGPAHFLNLLTPELSPQDELDNLGEHIYSLRAKIVELEESNEKLAELLHELEINNLIEAEKRDGEILGENENEYQDEEEPGEQTE